MADVKRTVSVETRAKLSVANMGHTVSLEARAKISAAAMGRTSSRKGAVLSVETRTKISVARTGYKASPDERAGNSASKMGHLVSLETRAKMSSAQWRGGKRVMWRKVDAKRRTLGFIQLNEPFAGCDGHHVDNEQVINEPRELHRSIWHSQRTGKGMAQSNAIAYNFLFKQEIEEALKRKYEKQEQKLLLERGLSE
jgi:hypothetical protein